MERERQFLMQAMVAFGFELMMDDDSDDEELQIHEREAHITITQYAELLIPRMSNNQFQNNFRLSRSTFDVLLRCLLPHLTSEG
jgi:hypothetical protein